MGHDKEYELNRASVDAVSEELVGWMQKSGICSIGSAADFSKMGRFVIVRQLLDTFLYAGIGLIMLVPFFHLKWGVTAGGASQVGMIVETLFSVIPSNPVTPFAEGNILQIIFMAVMSGTALLVLEERTGKIRDLVIQTMDLFQEIIAVVCRLLPFYIFTSLAVFIVENGLGVFVRLWRRIREVFILKGTKIVYNGDITGKESYKMGKPAYTVPEARRVRYIIHTDCKNEADDQYTVAHCLLTPLFEVKGIIAAHFNNSSGRYPDGATAKASYDEIFKVTDAMGITGKYPVKMGAAYPMENENTPVDSEGARLIIEEAMKDDPRPLFIGLQGSITDLASAILMEPAICGRMTAIWIGGGPYPKGGEEFNLSQDIAAANVVMKSAMPLWQVPSNIYKHFAVSLAELQCRVRPYGPLGKYLFEELIATNREMCGLRPNFNWPHGELWGLGDEGVVAALMHEGQRTDMYHMVPAPLIDYETMAYKLDTDNREIRVYDEMDYRLTLEDLFAKIMILAE